jgi:hypothetical protein
VREALDARGADGARGLEDGFLLVRVRRHLRGPELAALEQDGVRERAADVYAQDRHGPGV